MQGASGVDKFLRADIVSFVHNVGTDNKNMTGRAVARIFHGIQSPAFPAVRMSFVFVLLCWIDEIAPWMRLPLACISFVWCVGQMAAEVRGQSW